MNEQDKVKGLCERLMKGLRLETVPVAVQFSSKPPENVPLLEEETKAFSLLDIARLAGKTFYTEAPNHTCKNGSHILGMTKPFAGFETGVWFCGKYPDEGRSMYPSPVVARRNNEFYIKVDPQTAKNLFLCSIGSIPI